MYDERESTPTRRLNRSRVDLVPAVVSREYTLVIDEAFTYGEKGKISMGKMLLECSRLQAQTEDQRWSARLVARVGLALAYYCERFGSAGLLRVVT